MSGVSRINTGFALHGESVSWGVKGEEGCEIFCIAFGSE
jgi:hypothetical protein